MPDWKEEVRKHLPSDRLRVADPDAIVSELATHLEETYAHARLQGLDEAAALKRTLQVIEDGHVLAQKIIRAKESAVNHRTKSLWLPALVTLFAASVSLTLFQVVGVRPRLLWVGPWAFTLYWAWLATLPGIGAFGGYLSRRAQAPATWLLAASLSPALVMLIVMCVILPWGLVIDGFHFFRLIGFGLGLINWVVIPGIALLPGALPFLLSNDAGSRAVRTEA